MRELMQSMCIMSVIFLIDMISNTFKTFWEYFSLFFLIVALFFTFSASAFEVTDFLNESCLITEEDEDWVDPSEDDWTKSQEHLKWAVIHYKTSKSIVWFMPEYDDIDKAKLCFTSACVGMAPANAYVKFIAITLNLASQYGLDCIDRYKEMTHFLHRAHYHADLHLFYEDILNQKIRKGYVVIHRHVDENGNPID